MTTATLTDNQSKIETLDEFYAYVREKGKLRTDIHARRWTTATLNILGVNISRGTKKGLKNALPEALREDLTGVFWLAYFRNTNISQVEFCNRVSRRSRANSDPDFARFPVRAVFAALKQLVDPNLADMVRDDLSPEVSRMWENA